MCIDIFAGQAEFWDRFVVLKGAHLELRDLVEVLKKPTEVGHSKQQEEEHILSRKNSNETTHISDTPSPGSGPAEGTAPAYGPGIGNSPFTSERKPLTSTPEENNPSTYQTDCSLSPIKATSGNSP